MPFLFQTKGQKKRELEKVATAYKELKTSPITQNVKPQPQNDQITTNTAPTRPLLEDGGGIGPSGPPDDDGMAQHWDIQRQAEIHAEPTGRISDSSQDVPGEDYITSIRWLGEAIYYPLLSLAERVGKLWDRMVTPEDIANVVDFNPLDYLVAHCNEVDTDHGSLAADFFDITFTSTNRVKNNAHAKLHNTREAALGAFRTLAHNNTKTIYDIQASNQSRDKMHNNGLATTIWDSDLKRRPMCDAIPEDAILQMIDTANYLDMDKFVANKPLLLYTFRPTKPADSNSEMQFRVDPNNRFHTIIQGGTTWSEEVWEWTDKVFTNSAFRRWWNPFSYQTTTYRSYVRQIDTHYAAVLVVPIHSTGIIGSFARWLRGVSNAPLNRFQPVQPLRGQKNPLAIIRTTGNDPKVHASTPHLMSYTSVTFAADKFDYAMMYLAREGNKANSNSIQSRIGQHGEDLSHSDILLGNDVSNPAMMSVPVATQVYTAPTTQDTLTPLVIPIFPPIFANGCYVPAKTPENDDFCINERMIKCRKDMANDTQVENMFQDFLKEVPTMMHPVEAEIVAENMKRPNQKYNLQLGLDNLQDMMDVRNAFLKAETYNEPKPPRPITTSNPCHKLIWARYQLAEAMWLKEQPWYAFGKTPKEIAERVAEICSKSTLGVQDGDLRKMDGNIVELVRKLELTLHLHFFHPKYHAEIREQHKLAYNGRVRLGDRIVQSLFQRGSGNPETSNANSFLTRFIIYFARRLDGWSHEDAIRDLCIVGGDDSKTADLPDDLFIRAAARLGQSAKPNFVKRGSLGANFLSRFYGPEVWYGDPTSICDIPRILVKFHTTVNLPQNTSKYQELRMIEKANSLYLTDSNTPIVGDIAEALISRRPDYKDCDATNWWAQYDRTEQWPNVVSDWAQDYLGFWNLEYSISRVTGLERVTHLIKTLPWGQLMLTPLTLYDFEQPIHHGIVINGEMQLDPKQPKPETVPRPPLTESSNETSKRKAKRAARNATQNV